MTFDAWFYPIFALLAVVVVAQTAAVIWYEINRRKAESHAPSRIGAPERETRRALCHQAPPGVTIITQIARMRALIFRTFVAPRSKLAFLPSLAPTSRILDVGCGNDSPFLTKGLLPNCHYTGLDISDYNQSQPNVADVYLLTTSDKFAAEIERLQGSFDAVVSTHNLEHCDERDRVLEAMLRAVRPGGQIYLSFPCEASVSFPPRRGTLNYYDDATHRDRPPSFVETLATVQRHGFKVLHATRRHRPWAFWLWGLLSEPRSRRQNKVFYSTWCFYGFEAIICARKAV